MASELVDLLQRYSNNPAYLVDARTALKAVAQDDPTDDEPPLGGGETRPPKRLWSMEDRLGAETIHEIVDLFRRGATIRELAGKYSVSESSIKRVLRDHGARKRRLKPPE